MTTDQLISKAIHAIRTDQPRLAQLYMRNALQQVDQHRKDLNPLGWQARRMAEGLHAIGDVLTQAGKAWGRILDGFINVFTRTADTEHRKSDYTLT